MPFRGALAYVGTQLAAKNGVPGYTIPFDSESYDTDNIHSTVTNTTRLTVPANVSKIKLSCGVVIGACLADAYLAIGMVKNGVGGLFPGIGNISNETGDIARYVGFTTPAITVVPGDYFEIVLYTEATETSVNIESLGTWFAMEVVS